MLFKELIEQCLQPLHKNAHLLVKIQDWLMETA